MCQLKALILFSIESVSYVSQTRSIDAHSSDDFSKDECDQEYFLYFWGKFSAANIGSIFLLPEVVSCCLNMFSNQVQ